MGHVFIINWFMNTNVRKAGKLLSDHILRYLCWPIYEKPRVISDPRIGHSDFPVLSRTMSRLCVNRPLAITTVWFLGAHILFADLLYESSWVWSGYSLTWFIHSLHDCLLRTVRWSSANSFWAERNAKANPINQPTANAGLHKMYSGTQPLQMNTHGYTWMHECATHQMSSNM